MLYPHLQIKLRQRELVSLVGGGGKTTAMFKLAAELKAQGASVLVTTTTAIYQPENINYDTLIIGKQAPLPTPGITVWGREKTAENKLLGTDPELINELFNHQVFDFILVEADGAKGCPVKAPAAHEPLVPAATTKYIGVIGLSCLGTSTGEGLVHRPEIWCSLTGAQPGEIISEVHLTTLIRDPNGLFKNAPAHSQRYLLLNQAQTSILEQAGNNIIAYLAALHYPIDGGIVADLHRRRYHSQPARGFVSGVIMASGFSRRCPHNKLLLDYQGKSLLEWVIQAAQASDLQEVILVYQHPEIEKLATSYGLTMVSNPHAAIGQSEAVKLGTKAASAYAQGIMFLPGDQPLINKEIINRLLEQFITGNCQVVQPFYANNPGSPVVMSTCLRQSLLQLTGDEGGRTIIRQLPPAEVKGLDIENVVRGFDVDTAEDYLQLLKVEL